MSRNLGAAGGRGQVHQRSVPVPRRHDRARTIRDARAITTGPSATTRSAPKSTASCWLAIPPTRWHTINARSVCSKSRSDTARPWMKCARPLTLVPNHMVYRINLALFANAAGEFETVDERNQGDAAADPRAMIALAYSQIGRGHGERGDGNLRKSHSDGPTDRDVMRLPASATCAFIKATIRGVDVPHRGRGRGPAKQRVRTRPRSNDVR